MTSSLWIASLLVATALAAPLEKADAKFSYAYAVDVAAATNTQIFNCYRQQNYMTAFVQVYQPANGGSVNLNGPANVQNAISGMVLLGCLFKLKTNYISKLITYPRIYSLLYACIILEHKQRRLL
jgi:hypothetical protein